MGRPKGSKNKVSKKIKRTCFCGKVFYVYPSRIKVKKGKYCSKKCYNIDHIGERHSPSTEFKKGIRNSIKTEFKKGITGEKCKSWKGGISSCHGYIKIYASEHPKNNHKYVLEHRLIMEKHIGRYLKDTEIIHHLNGIKNDNRIENLKIVTRAEHLAIHKVYFNKSS